MTFCCLVCDESSINIIRTSNHSLLAVCYSNFEDSLPDNLSSLFKLNQTNNRPEAARQKMIRRHFLNGYVIIREFVDMELKVLPNVIE